MPPEPRVQFTVQHGVVDDGVGPGPERPIYLMVSPQQFSREGTRQANSLRQSPFALAVLGTENALFAKLSLRLVALPSRVRRHHLGLFGERQVTVAALVCPQHRRITREHGGDSKLLLGPVDVRDSVSGWWLD